MALSFEYSDFDNSASHLATWNEPEIDAMLTEYLLDEDQGSEGAFVFDLAQVNKNFHLPLEADTPTPGRMSVVSADGQESPLGAPQPLGVQSANTSQMAFPSARMLVPNPLAPLWTEQTVAENQSLKRLREEETIPTTKLLPCFSKNHHNTQQKDAVPVVANSLQQQPLKTTTDKKAPKRRRVSAAVKKVTTTTVSVEQPITEHAKTAVVPTSNVSVDTTASQETENPKGQKGSNSNDEERKKERNRLLAKKSRQKKKNMFETLQKEVSRLGHENQVLKAIIKTKLDGFNLDKLLADCDNQANSTPSIELFVQSMSSNLVPASEAA